MKKVIAILVVLLAVGAVMFVVFWRPPMPTPIEYLAPISLEGCELPEEVTALVPEDDEYSIAGKNFVLGDNIPLEVHSQEDAVLAFMYVRSYWEIGDEWPEFICVRDNVSNDGLRVFEFQQLYKGVLVKSIEIRDVAIKITVSSKTGKVLQISGNYLPGLNRDVTPEISAHKAQKSFSLKFGEWIDAVQLTIFSGRLCWRFNVKGREVSSYCYIYVGAKNGEIVLKQPTMIS